MNILVVTPGYPTNKQPYNNSFVHQRMIGYMNHGVNVQVFSVVGNPYRYQRQCSEKGPMAYLYESISVLTGTHGDLALHLQQHAYDKILIHFAWGHIMRVVNEHAPKTPLIIWVHGVEALSWHRRLFNLSSNPIDIIKFMSYIVLNVKQMVSLRRNVGRPNSKLVFVSEWMRRILMKDAYIKNSFEYEVIPNVVNEAVFSYERKTAADRYKVFHIRPYHSRKYANDIMVKTILKLSNKTEFKQLSFFLYGDGRNFESTVRPLRAFKNVHIERGLLKQSEIADKHKFCGVLLMPTRQDAQGVSMCEAMSSGLVPVVSNNTAIPEFVSSECGYLCDSVNEMADAILDIVHHPEIFLLKSQLASSSIQKKCARDVVLEKEISLILKN